MKIRESGMPEREMWEKFFSPAKILTALGLDSQTGDVVEFGCGYGTFTIPAAKIIKGKIYALDIEPDMISMTDDEAKKQGLSNVQTIQRDFIAEGSGLPDECADYVMLFNILHLEKPMFLINEAKRVLRSGGKLGIIHWNYDPKTPRGPSMDIRPKPEDCIKWAQSAGFTGAVQYDLKPYHYGIVLTKSEAGVKTNMIAGLVVIAVIIFTVACIGLNKAYSHCDTMGGPVIKDAQSALENKDITPVLKWIKKEKKPEIRAAFEGALVERVKSPEAKEEADMNFFETLVRIHRQEEGAPFTGVKPADAIDPIEAESDKALEAGSVDNLTAEMSQHLTGGIKERFARVLEKKKYMNDSVDAGREYVEAYVEYLHYVEGVHKAIAGEGGQQHEE